VIAVAALAAVALFVLDGLNVRSPRFEPRGFGLAVATFVVLWPAIQHLGG